MIVRKYKGITLLELLIAVAVVAILASVAYPSFMHHLQASRRAEAIKGLLSMQLEQETYRITHNSYSNAVSALGNPTSDYYTFTVSSATSSAYSLVATPKGSQSGDTACNPMTINKADSKTPPECWK